MIQAAAFAPPIGIQHMHNAEQLGLGGILILFDSVQQRSADVKLNVE
jgi:hypothetical protein